MTGEDASVGALAQVAVTETRAATPDFEPLFRREYASVVRIARQLGIPAGEADDVAQSVFIVVFRRLDSYDPSRPVRPWLYGITRRVVSNHQRSKTRAQERERKNSEEPKVESTCQDPLQGALRQQLSLIHI